MALCWYVVQTKYKLEIYTANNLREQKFRVFCPTFLDKPDKRKQQKISALFPTYIFVQFDINEDPWYRIKGTRGVKEIITTAEQHNPLAVPDEFMENLIKSTEKLGVSSKETDEEDYSFIVPGAQVVVNINNNINAISGTVVTKEKDKAIVNIYLLNRQISVSLPIRLIIPAPQVV